MTPACIKWLLPATAFAIAACADHADEATAAKPIAPPTQAETESEYKKPVRMHDRGKVSSISLEDFFVLHESGQAMVIDARPAIFHQFGRIPGAINIPPKNCDTAIFKREDEIKAAIAAGKTIVVYCSGFMCPDARTVAMHISGFGYPASVFSGGWDAWKEAGMAVE
jgi:3-mercaptopyruvate sulfurtransferase SseA